MVPVLKSVWIFLSTVSSQFYWYTLHLIFFQATMWHHNRYKICLSKHYFLHYPFESLIPYLSLSPLIHTQRKMFFTLQIKSFSEVKINPEKILICKEKHILGTPAILRGACNFGDAYNSRNAGKSNLFFPHVSPTQRFLPRGAPTRLPPRSWRSHPAISPQCSVPTLHLLPCDAPTLCFQTSRHPHPAFSPLVARPSVEFPPSRRVHLWLFPIAVCSSRVFPLRRAAWCFPPLRCAHSTCSPSWCATRRFFLRGAHNRRFCPLQRTISDVSPCCAFLVSPRVSLTAFFLPALSPVVPFLLFRDVRRMAERWGEGTAEMREDAARSVGRRGGSVLNSCSKIQKWRSLQYFKEIMNVLRFI